MLKALELAGFKSFADRTKFQFPAGVTVIVGPNGSGKSNVVDAMKWVLGTQSAKALRGGEMRDVIFNGSRSRKPLNAAEVTLTLDNGGGVFPHEGAEIQVTRRVYRSGEAEYLLNRQPCRLRDVRDLLSSAGIANEAYGIIEQGKVDAMLQSAPRDRRAIFEEAAGINRFRSRKLEATRRLERVDHNLLRLTDIVSEVESRLSSLRSQAGKAQRYREQADRLRQLRTQLGLADWHKFTTELSAMEASKGQLESARVAQQHRAAELEAAATQLQAQSERLQTYIRDGESEIGKSRESIAERRTLCTVLAQRIDSLNAETKHARRQLLAMTVRSEGREDASRDAAWQLQLASDAYASARTQMDQSKFVLHQARTELAQQKEHREKLRHAHTGVVSQAPAFAQREQVLRSQCESVRAAGRSANEESHKLTAQRATLTNELHELQAQESSAIREAARCHSELAAAQQRLEGRRRDLTAAHKQLSALEAELARLHHRRELLVEQHRRVDRLEQDLHALASQTSQPVFHGMVADVVQVDVDLAPLVETALGERARDIILAAGSELLAAIASAEQLNSRLVFSRLDWRSPASAVDRVDLTGEPGVVGRADQFVETDEQYQPLVRRLLGRTWLVDSLDTAYRLAGSIGKGLHFVSAAGEYVSADGVVAVGPRPEAVGLLTWRNELQRVQQLLAAEQSRRSELHNVIQALESAADTDAAEVQERLAAHAPLAERVAALGQQRAARTERSRQIDIQLERLADQEHQRNHELEWAELALEEVATQRRDLEIQTRQLVAAVEKASAAVHELELRCGQLQEFATERQVALAKAEQHLEILRAQAEQLHRDQQERDQALSDAHAQLQRAVAELQRQELELLRNSAVVAELSLHQEAAAARIRDAVAQELAIRSKRNELAQQSQRLRREEELLAAKRQQLELRMSEVKLHRQALAQRMQEDIGIDLVAAAESPQQVPLETDARRAEIERTIAELRSSLNVIGPVNLDAIEELDELQSRFDGLAAQRRDLVEAKSAIEQLVVRINNETRQLFLTTIDVIRGHFQELFRRLFGGGEADLVLVVEEGEDVLEGGIEITACPPGKETRTISLLSGGEKTLTCIALLLAVFRSRPSPFCILDEVDAALDEANIGRFTTVLSEFLSSTQFVVVTHSKRTMAGAQTLLGVTMQESGISKQISVKLEDVDEEGNIRSFAPRRAA